MPVFINERESCSVLYCIVVPVRSLARSLAGYYRRYIRPSSPVNMSARRQLVRRRSLTAAAAAAACHAEHEMQHYYRSIDSQDGLTSVGPAKPLSHVSPFCFQLPSKRLQALIDALHDYMLYSASLQLNKMLS